MVVVLISAINWENIKRKLHVHLHSFPYATLGVCTYMLLVQHCYIFINMFAALQASITAKTLFVKTELLVQTESQEDTIVNA